MESSLMIDCDVVNEDRDARLTLAGGIYGRFTSFSGTDTSWWSFITQLALLNFGAGL